MFLHCKDFIKLSTLEENCQLFETEEKQIQEKLKTSLDKVSFFEQFLSELKQWLQQKLHHFRGVCISTKLYEWEKIT